MAAERYERPPLVATEPPSRRAAVWRFRLVFLVFLLALAAAIALAVRAVIGSSGEGSPGIGAAPAAAPPTVVSPAPAR